MRIYSWDISCYNQIIFWRNYSFNHLLFSLVTHTHTHTHTHIYIYIYNINIIMYDHKVRHHFCVYNKLDWSVYTCLAQQCDGRAMYVIYYIKNNYMFRPFSMVIIRLIN